MSSWHTYPKVFNVGHAAIADLLTVPVVVQEKIDGSQFSFGMIDGELRMRSKGQEVYVGDTGLFANAVITAHVLFNQGKLTEGWTYRTEYVSKPKHNTLAYSTTPRGFLVLFDINVGEECYAGQTLRQHEANKLGISLTPVLFTGMLTREIFDKLLDTESILGGQKIEGIVIKQAVTTLYGPDKKALIGKYVSEKFKEIHEKSWKLDNPSKLEAIDRIGQMLRTPARWEKSVIHMREDGVLANAPQDIGPLIRRVSEDVKEECENEIKEQLFKYAWPKISRIVIAGLPEWYKLKLANIAFADS